MNFLDAAFLFAFLPVTLLVFSVAGRLLGPTAALVVMSAASIVFCAPFGWGFTSLVLLSAIVNFVLGRMILRNPTGGGGWLALGMAFNLGALIVFKYGPIFAWIPGATPFASRLAAFIPITISFLTFQRIVLLLDVYQRQPAAAALLGVGPPRPDGTRGGVIAYSAFVFSFPNLVIGPIAYASETTTKLLSKSFGRVRRADLETGLFLLTVGLIKKVLIADPLGLRVVNTVFEKVHQGHSVLAAEVAVAMVGYYAQLYFDFSGYSDMALGIGRMFGLRFPINFNSPLRATGIVDFYRRWHITLTRIVARFLFQPLSIMGARFAGGHDLKGVPARLVSAWAPLMVNFLVIGIWHGASWTFVLFGLVHGGWFILETETRRLRAWKRFAKATSERLRRRLGQVITFIPLMITFSLFHSHSLGDFLRLFDYMQADWLDFFDRGRSHFILKQSYPWLISAFAVIWLAPNAYEMAARYKPGIVTFPAVSHTPGIMRWAWRPNLLWGAITAVGGLLVLRALGAPAPFVYGGF